MSIGAHNHLPVLLSATPQHTEIGDWIVVLDCVVTGTGSHRCVKSMCYQQKREAVSTPDRDIAERATPRSPKFEARESLKIERRPASSADTNG